MKEPKIQIKIHLGSKELVTIKNSVRTIKGGLQKARRWIREKGNPVLEELYLISVKKVLIDRTVYSQYK